MAHLVDEDDLIKSSLLATKASEIEMTMPDEPAWVYSYKECVSLLREVENLRTACPIQRRKSGRRR